MVLVSVRLQRLLTLICTTIRFKGTYGDSSGRAALVISQEQVDMQDKLPEFEIVGPVIADDVGITSIRQVEVWKSIKHIYKYYC